MLALLGLALLMHRIQNIVVPPRSLHRVYHGQDRSFFRRVYAHLLPLDFSATSTPLAFHLPTLYFLSKQLLVWTTILLQTADLYPAGESGYVWTLGQWVQQQEMQDVCWRTFCSICAAFSIESFVRGLDGGGLGMVQINANTSPFNLIGYSFLLHIYSSPITHVYIPQGLPSRPDKHVIVSITIPLLQLTIFHILSIRKRWSSHRFFPTALSSILALVHFHSTLYMHYFRPSPPSPPIAHPLKPTISTVAGKFPAPTPPPRVRSPGPLYSRPTGSGSFPLLNYVPNTFETLLILTISLTVALNMITQLLLTGRVTRPLLGLGLTSNGAWAWAPPYDEDWGVVLLRVGTASLEATGLRGWGNELPSVTVAPIGQRFPPFGVAQIGAGGVVQVSSGFGMTLDGMRLRPYRKRGFGNEVKEMDVGARPGSAFGAKMINWRWLKEAGKFSLAAFAAGRGLARGLWQYFRTGRRMWGRAAAVPQNAEETMVDADEEEEEEEEDADALDEEDQDALYGRFLRQEDISDDEEQPAGEWDVAETSEDEGGDDEDALDSGEAITTYADLAETTSTQLLLAHLARDDGLPLTRRRYSALLEPGPSSASPVIPYPRHSPQVPVDAGDDSRRNCVICTVETRDVICWPCRCLSMCNGCREVLASRSSASKHRCPCCREVVKGYSRIFIP